MCLLRTTSTGGKVHLHGVRVEIGKMEKCEKTIDLNIEWHGEIGMFICI